MTNSGLYRTAFDFELQATRYFEECDREGRPYTLPGISYFLGFAGKYALNQYAKKEKFAYVVQRVKTRIETQRVENLVAGKGSTPGQIFDLKNSFGYTDRPEPEKDDSNLIEIMKILADKLPD